MIHLMQDIYSFGDFLECLKNFKNRFFLVTPLHLKAHAMVCMVGNDMRGRCTNLFNKYWNNSHLLMRNELYLYKGDELSEENMYLKKWMMGFVKVLGYPRGVTPQDKDSRRTLKLLNKSVTP